MQSRQKSQFAASLKAQSVTIEPGRDPNLRRVYTRAPCVPSCPGREEIPAVEREEVVDVPKKMYFVQHTLHGYSTDTRTDFERGTQLIILRYSTDTRKRCV